MAYTKQTWVNGDVITADKLNHIEEGIENNESGYSINEEETILFEGEVTLTEPNLFYVFNPPIIFNQENLIIICDGQEYQCEKKEITTEGSIVIYYGDLDLENTGDIIYTNYPFFLGEDPQAPTFDIFFSTGGSHSIIIKTLIKTVTIKEDFSKAVNNCVNIDTINNIKDSQNYSIVEGLLPNSKITYENKEYSSTIIDSNSATGLFSHAEGGGWIDQKSDPPVVFKNNSASGMGSHAEGSGANASGDASHAEGQGTKASGLRSHAEGGGTTASGLNSHTEGGGTTASESCSHAEGGGATASGENSHAEGGGTTASGDSSHAEGGGTTASGGSSHAEGGGTTASGGSSHAEGGDTTASGFISHAEGNGTIANHKSQHVFGQYNVEDPSSTNNYQRGNYVCIIGNGTGNSTRSNAFAIKWDGTIVLSDGTEVTQAQIKQLLALLN